jgi:hypothetical protein
MSREEIITFLLARRFRNPRLVAYVDRDLFEQDYEVEIADIEAILKMRDGEDSK